MSCPTPNQGQPHHLSTRAHLLLSIQENCSNRSLLCLLDYFYLSLCWVIPGIIGTNCYYSCLKKKNLLSPLPPWISFRNISLLPLTINLLKLVYSCWLQVLPSHSFGVVLPWDFSPSLPPNCSRLFTHGLHVSGSSGQLLSVLMWPSAAFQRLNLLNLRSIFPRP